MMKPGPGRTAVGAVLVLLGGLVVAVDPGTANAQPTTKADAIEHAKIGATGTGLRSCVWAPRRGVGGVNVRSRPTTNSTRIGIMYEGQSAFGACETVIYGYYTACGAMSNGWRHIYWGGTHGYVAATCVQSV